MTKRIEDIGFPAFFKKYRWWIISAVGVWFVYVVFVFMLILLPYYEYDTDGGAEGHGSHYVRLSQDNTGVIVFVHGVLGDGISTWTNPETKAYWPDLLKNDPIFDGYNIFVYEFSSRPIGKSYAIPDLADDMGLVLRNADVLEHKELIFLCHSMGGLVTRALLLNNRELIDKIGFIYFFSTPTTGSDTAKIAELLSKNPQFHNMFPMGDNTYIDSLQSSWFNMKKKPRSFCAYEILDTWGIKVVARQSATNLCTEPLNPILADHISIVKPADDTSKTYTAFKNAFHAAHKF